MKPVFQTKFGTPDGNCFAASLASILEIELEECVDLTGVNDKFWQDRVLEWVQDKPYHVMWCAMKIEEMSHWVKDVHYLETVKTTRGTFHSVVSKNGEIVHDPFPGGIDIEKRNADGVFVFVLKK